MGATHVRRASPSTLEFAEMKAGHEVNRGEQPQTSLKLQSPWQTSASTQEAGEAQSRRCGSGAGYWHRRLLAAACSQLHFLVQ